MARQFIVIAALKDGHRFEQIGGSTYHQGLKLSIWDFTNCGPTNQRPNDLYSEELLDNLVARSDYMSVMDSVVHNPLPRYVPEVGFTVGNFLDVPVGIVELLSKGEYDHLHPDITGSSIAVLDVSLERYKAAILIKPAAVSTLWVTDIVTKTIWIRS